MILTEKLVFMLKKSLENDIDISNTRNREVTGKTHSNEWFKCLKDLPVFIIWEIESHRLNSGKSPDTAIIKILDRGRKFKEERYLSADSIYTKPSKKLHCQTHM